MYRRFRHFLGADGGGSATEYGLVGAMIAIAVIVGVLFAGDTLRDLYNYIGSELSNAMPQFGKLR